MKNDQIQERVIAFVSGGGVTPRSFRDAIHEASHAIDLDIDYGDWDRELIHSYIMQLDKSDRIRTELLARAVEWSACDRFNIEYNPEHYALIAFIEAIKSGVWMPDSIVESIDSLRGEESDLILDKILNMSMSQG